MDITILGIESSCDDTSAAVIRNGVLLSNNALISKNTLGIPLLTLANKMWDMILRVLPPMVANDI